ncbi:MAG: HD domain-containing protein [Dehalococcoidales bacterium]|nr:HD domain-containing protein [Dehalococcoidales bacterium]
MVVTDPILKKGSSNTMGDDLSTALIEPEALSLLTVLSNFLAGQKVRAYLVGGFVRDVLLGRDTADIDIAVSTDVMKIGPQVAELLQGKFVLLDEVNRIGRVILKDWVIDIAFFTGEIEADLKRRDFTIDAMAIDLRQLDADNRNTSLIDPYSGRLDLDRGLIRTVTDTAFESDPVRLLRAVRLVSELGFTIDRKTENEIQQSAHLIAGVPGERVREELLQLLESSHGGEILHYMDKLGLLIALIPELAPLKGVSQPAEHHWDVFEHSIQTVSTVDFILRHGIWDAQGEEVLAAVPWSPSLAQYFNQTVNSGSTRRSLLKLAALLHDIAKPQAKAFDENGRMRFLGHPEQGAALAEGILERFRFSVREAKLVLLMIKYHLRPTQMSQDDLPTSRAIYRYFRDVGEVGIDTLYLSLADHLATRGPGLLMPHWQFHTQLVAYVLKEHPRGEKAAPVKLIDGNDLINVYGMKPGARIGELLEEVREAQAAGELTTREEALDYIRNSLLTEGK